MKALTWQGITKVSVDTMPDPEIINPRDAIIKVTSTAICGSDLHLYDGVIPGMKAGDILGHEFMGEVIETGPKSTLKMGQRVVVPFTISCGSCFFCAQGQFSACDNGNPVENQDASEKLYGHAMGAAFGYSHLTGGYPGGQAEYARVPFSMLARSSFQTVWRTNRCCSSPTSCPQAGWPPRTQGSSPAIP